MVDVYNLMEDAVSVALEAAGARDSVLLDQQARKVHTVLHEFLDIMTACDGISLRDRQPGTHDFARD